MKSQAIIIGAGPAGLTAAYELTEQTDIQPFVIEESNEIGGISKTVNHNNNRIDIGGHRFFSKEKRVMDWWLKIMPLQGQPAADDILLNRQKKFPQQGPDPEKDDRVMLIRDRVSRIFYQNNFFDYPISIKAQTFINMGLTSTLKAGFGYLYSACLKREEKSLEDFYINRFGKPLYKMFFEDYTEKVWGVHPSQLDADWGAQRVKGLSIFTLLKNVAAKPFRKTNIRQQKTETSLIEEFIYPKYGPGQLWETVAHEFTSKGGRLKTESTVTDIYIENNRVCSVDITENGTKRNIPCDYLLSSMPIKDLIAALRGIDIPESIKNIASSLPYRDFITVGLLVKKLNIKNHTKRNTYAQRIPDTWVYIQDRSVKLGRLQVFNNWSPYMVNDYKNTMFIGLEYFCNEGDEMWNMSEKEFVQMAIGELEKIDLLSPENVLDSIQIKVKKAYPAYFGSYTRINEVIKFLDSIENLFCIGRNGQHRYNNMDHSMLTAMEAVNNIKNNIKSKQNIWNINTAQDYHEQK